MLRSPILCSQWYCLPPVRYGRAFCLFTYRGIVGSQRSLNFLSGTYLTRPFYCLGPRFPSFPLFAFLLPLSPTFLLSFISSLLPPLFPSPSSLPPSLPPFLPSFLPSSHDSSGACNYVCMELCSPGHFINLLCIMFTSPLVGGAIVVMSAVVGGALW